MAASAKAIRRTTGSIGGDWLARDIDGWRVGVPCQGGSGRFRFADYGGSVQKALAAARKFQTKALALYKSDKAYAIKNGERPQRETVYITNRSGVRGVYRMVHPRMGTTPTIEWVGTVHKNGRLVKQGFSTANFPEDVCKRKAIEWRNKNK